MKKLSSLAVVALVLMLSGPVCADRINAEISIGMPPPAVREEVIPVAPGPEAMWAWHKGHWRWIDGAHVWVPGHWVQRPRPEAVWVEPRWEHRGENWVFVEGRWK